MLPRHAPLRRGDLVEVRPAARSSRRSTPRAARWHSVHAGDDRAPRTAVPGRARREKICGTPPRVSRRLPNTVLLEDLRCDGPATADARRNAASTGRRHGSSTWMNAMRLDHRNEDSNPLDFIRQGLATSRGRATTRPPDWDGTDERFRCQATEAVPRDGAPLGGVTLGNTTREVRSGNLPLRRASARPRAGAL